MCRTAKVPDKEFDQEPQISSHFNKKAIKLLTREMFAQHDSHVSVKERLPIHLESCRSNTTGINRDAQPHSENFFDVQDDVIAGSASLWDSLSCLVNPAQLTQNDDKAIRLY